MHELYKLKDSLVKELEDLGKQGVSKSNIEMVDKLAHAAKNVGKVIECCEDEQYSNRGYSRRMSYADGRSYADGSYAYPEENYVRPDGSYSRRGRARDAMGRYSGDGGVDEHTKEELMKLIEKM